MIVVFEGIYFKCKLKFFLIWYVYEIIVKLKVILDFINFLMGCYVDMIVIVLNVVVNYVK